MMRTIQSKITLTFVSLAVVVIALLGVLLSYELEKSFFERLTSQLETETRTAEALLHGVQPGADGREKGEALLHILSSTTKSRITLVAMDGALVYDSWIADSSLTGLENHATRSEIVQARLHNIGWDRRPSKSIGEDLFYFAKVARLESVQLEPFNHTEYIRVAISVREVDDAIREIRLKTLLAGVIALAVGIVASRMLARYVAKPLVQISDVIERIQEGDFDQKLPVLSNDEIGKLAALVNTMTDKLKADIEQLKKLERVRSEFLGNVSHELRTPIFSLKGFLETLLDGAVNDPAVNKNFIEKAYKHANRLDALLSDLIEISRIESGEMKMSFRYFDVGPFLQQIVEDNRDQCARKQQVVELVVPQKELLVFGDKELLKLAVSNIVDNAAKYSPAGATIKVEAVEKENAVAILVEDNGPGIESEHLPRIFERFYRVDKTRSREVGGTGLGLAIVKHIVEAHGSRVNVTSEVGKGTVFTFDLRK